MLHGTAAELLQRALDLPAEDRLAIATALVNSVEGSEDEEWSDAWLNELDRRYVHIEQGEPLEIFETVKADARIRELHDRAVRELVEAHSKRTEEPLVLAVRYRADEPLDVYLLEVLQGFPGGDDDPLLSTEFEPSVQLRIVGKLHLLLGSPAQVRAAVERKDAIIDAIRRGTTAYDDGSSVAADVRLLLKL